MLEILRIRNLAIVDEIEIEFSRGLNVLTGETGAGKSVVLKAIDLITGKRSSADIIRAGEERCEVEGLFLLEQNVIDSLQEQIPETEGLLAGEEFIIRRIVESNGRSKVYLNGVLSTVSLLQKVGLVLVDMTGQHSQQQLLESSSHRESLDLFGVKPSLLTRVRKQYACYAEEQRKLRDFLEASQTKQDYFRRIAFECSELEPLGLREGEREELEAELKKGAGFEELTALLQEGINILSEDERGVEGSLVKLESVLEKALQIDSEVKSSLELVRSSRAELSEVTFSLADALSGLELDPARIEFLRARIAEIAQIERKYGKKEAELVSYFESIQEELHLFESGELDEQKLRENVTRARAELKVLEKELTAERIKVGNRLSKLVVAELGQLNMPRARFAVSLGEGESSLYGADIVEFLLAANPGDEPKSLSKVASGGELSRVLLVLKTLLNLERKPVLQIFDEVDSGVGGAVAQVVGEKLKSVSQNSQVVLVTHAPQIAAFADTHFVVAKESSQHSTRTVIQKLTKEKRVSEVARMLAGKEVTTKFEQSAQELMSLTQGCS